MVFINHSTQQMSAKIVYYGPGLCGKTTNLQQIFDQTPEGKRGEMVSLATETDRTLFFDLLPIEIGKIGPFNVRIQLYTVPGQVFYNSTRKLVLRGVDGVVFVADSQRGVLQANVDSLNNLEENLAEMNLSLAEIPLVLQFNKRDLPDVLSPDELNAALNRHSWHWFESSAIEGTGVFETLRMISKETLRHLRRYMMKRQEALEKKAATQPIAQTTPEQAQTGAGAAAGVAMAEHASSAAPAESVAGMASAGHAAGAAPERSATGAAPATHAAGATPEGSATGTTPARAARTPPAAGAVGAQSMPSAGAQKAPTPRTGPLVYSPPSSSSRPQDQRISEVLIFERLTIGKPCLLKVSLKRPAAPEGVAPEALSAAEKTSVDILLSAGDFHCVDVGRRTLTFAPGEDPEPVLFKLVPLRLGRQQVGVELFNATRYLGTVRVTTEVVAPETGEGKKSVAVGRSVHVLDREPQGPDLTLLVAEHRSNANSRSYRLTVHAPRHGLAFHELEEKLRFYGSPDAWTDGLYGDLATLENGTDQGAKAGVPETIGIDLYEKLFPRDLKKLWSEHIRGQARTISIVSDEEWIPWERIKPRYDDGTDDFLCADHGLARWAKGPPPPREIEIPPKKALRCAWQIPDAHAECFRASLEQALRAGKNLGEATRTARADLRSRSATSWLAYSLHADPLARARR